jgi:hypothetical protein
MFMGRPVVGERCRQATIGLTITYGKERAAEDLPITLDGARALLRTAISGAANPFYKHSKKYGLLSLYLNFWPARGTCNMFYFFALHERFLHR